MRSRLLFTFSAVALGALGVGSCATGSTFVGGAGGDGTGAVTTTTTHTTGTHSSSSSTGSATSSSSTSSSGSGCSESPCKLTSPQCGCGAGMAFSITGTSRACAAAGTTAQGQTCVGPTDCKAGLLCVGGGTAGICDKFCNTDADCAGAICALELSDGLGGSIPNATLCTNTCDLPTNTGCPSGTECQLGQEQSGQMRFFTFCTSSGTAGAHQSCTIPEDCAPTFGCFSSMICLQYCFVGSAACAGQCSPLQDASMNPIILNGQTLGVCP
jgi:hypothetical protein